MIHVVVFMIHFFFQLPTVERVVEGKKVGQKPIIEREAVLPVYLQIKHLWLLGFCCVMAVSTSLALPIELRFDTRLEALEGSGWQAQGVTLSLVQDPGREGALTLAIERLVVAGFAVDLQQVHLHCPAFTMGGERWRCSTATVRIVKPGAKPATGQLHFTYQPRDGQLEFAVSELAVAAGRVNLTGEFNAQGWRAMLNAADVEMALLADWLENLPAWPLAPGQNQGRISFDAEISGVGDELQTARLQLRSSGLSIATASGRYATQDLAFRFNGQWQAAGSFTANLRVAAGQMYMEPVFLQRNATQSPVTVQMIGRLQKRLLLLDVLRFNHPDVVRAQASASFLLGEENELRKLNLELEEAVFPAVYSVYMAPFLADAGLAGLRIQGRASGQMVVKTGDLHAIALEIPGLSFEDAGDRFSIKGLRGKLAWSSDRTLQRSKLWWDEAQLYRIDIGAAALRFVSEEGVLRLAEEMRVPILDGALVVNQMAAEGLGSTPLAWQFEGLLTPVSMGSLSAALGWPPLAGKLSGVIPDVEYTDGVLQVGGSLLIRIFEGDITITQLRIEDLLGPVPKASADLAIRRLDLMTLTQTFDFGNIEGKLSGHVDDLQLISWQPIGFDAVFVTPEGDDSKRRISQRAVKNLSALSGANPSAVLSRGFLNLFKAFRYKRLGIRCRLSRGICEMGGVGPADQGYYLVEGEGLPRIDIIGYNRRVDWQELVLRLRAAIESGDPVVK